MNDKPKHVSPAPPKEEPEVLRMEVSGIAMPEDSGVLLDTLKQLNRDVADAQATLDSLKLKQQPGQKDVAIAELVEALEELHSTAELVIPIVWSVSEKGSGWLEDACWNAFVAIEKYKSREEPRGE